MTLDEVRRGLRAARYITTPRVETALFLALTLEKPLLAEGPAGRGQDGARQGARGMLDTELVRLQCYEGLDEARALFEWNYQKQLLRIQADRAEGRSWEDVSSHIFSADFLLERPLLRAIVAPRRVVLLIDEVDKADPEFEAFLLEVLSDFQISVPELGTIRARSAPSSSHLEPHAGALEALVRRCLHLFVDFPGAEKEAEIIALKVPEADEKLRAQVARFVAGSPEARPPEGAEHRGDARLGARALCARRPRARCGDRPADALARRQARRGFAQGGRQGRRAPHRALMSLG
jgi:MoxR-like ATPase